MIKKLGKITLRDVFRFVGESDIYLCAGSYFKNLSGRKDYAYGECAGMYDREVELLSFPKKGEMEKELAIQVLTGELRATTPLLDMLIEKGVVDQLIQLQLRELDRCVYNLLAFVGRKRNAQLIDITEEDDHFLMESAQLIGWDEEKSGET